MGRTVESRHVWLDIQHRGVGKGVNPVDFNDGVATITCHKEGDHTEYLVRSTAFPGHIGLLLFGNRWRRIRSP